MKVLTLLRAQIYFPIATETEIRTTGSTCMLQSRLSIYLLEISVDYLGPSTGVNGKNPDLVNALLKIGPDPVLCKTYNRFAHY